MQQEKRGMSLVPLWLAKADIGTRFQPEERFAASTVWGGLLALGAKVPTDTDPAAGTTRKGTSVENHIAE